MWSIIIVFGIVSYVGDVVLLLALQCKEDCVHNSFSRGPLYKPLRFEMPLDQILQIITDLHDLAYRLNL